MSRIIHLLLAVVHVPKGLPERLALQLSFLESADDLAISASSGVGVGTSRSCSLNLLDQSLILFIEHSDVTLETISFSLHVTVDLGPLVLLLACDLVLLGDEPLEGARVMDLHLAVINSRRILGHI